MENPSLRKILSPNERLYITTGKSCDCGSVLVPIRKDGPSADDLMTLAESRLKRKGWSKSKIERALTEQKKNSERKQNNYSDSFDMWEAIFQDLFNDLKFSRIGIFIRSYTGALATEVFDVSQSEAKRGTSCKEALASMEYDKVLFVPAAGSHMARASDLSGRP